MDKTTAAKISKIWDTIYKNSVGYLARVDRLSAQMASSPIHKREFAKAAIALENMCQEAYSLSRMFRDDTPDDEEIGNTNFPR